MQDFGWGEAWRGGGGGAGQTHTYAWMWECSGPVTWPGQLGWKVTLERPEEQSAFFTHRWSLKRVSQENASISFSVKIHGITPIKTE